MGSHLAEAHLLTYMPFVRQKETRILQLPTRTKSRAHVAQLRDLTAYFVQILLVSFVFTTIKQCQNCRRPHTILHDKTAFSPYYHPTRAFMFLSL